MTDFYVHLQSDASWDYYPNNVISDFKTHLSIPIKIDPDLYKIALTECSYTFSNSKSEQEVVFKYENERMHIQLDCEKVTFNPKVSAKLGITHRIIDETNSINKIYRGQSKVFLPSGETKLFIYSDLIRGQTVDSGFSPLLRIIPYKGVDMETTVYEARHLQYIKLAKSEIDYLHIYIRTESGTNPPFQAGTFSATLHFKQII